MKSDILSALGAISMGAGIAVDAENLVLIAGILFIWAGISAWK